MLPRSGVIDKDDLPFKFKNEIHANEIVLLAYYIAAINIEAVYQDLLKDSRYAAESAATLKNSLYDSYIRAFRWASDRLGDEGVIGFVSGAAWIDRAFADGMRSHLKSEFSKIYVIHLRGDVRKNMLSKGLAGEGENVFGQSSMTGVCITVLVKKKREEDSEIYFYDIDRDLKRDQKLSILRHFKSINGIRKEDQTDQYFMPHGISDAELLVFQNAYPLELVTKEDIFYFVYGFLHSEEYRNRFQNNLSKELPRIPVVKKHATFNAFSDAGRKLANLNVNFEKVDPYPVTYKQGDLRLAEIGDPKKFYSVQKMGFAGSRGKVDKSTVIYNNNITMTNIPLDAYTYIVGGRSALDWVMERQRVRTDKESGIINDANDYANETMNNPSYPLELFQRVITVSLETMKLVNSLPPLDID